MKKPIEIPVSCPARKNIRYRIMRIINKNDDIQDDLKENIEKQFTEKMEWNNFLTAWDINTEEPFNVVELE